MRGVVVLLDEVKSVANVVDAVVARKMNEDILVEISEGETEVVLFVRWPTPNDALLEVKKFGKKVVRAVARLRVREDVLLKRNRGEENGSPYRMVSA